MATLEKIRSKGLLLLIVVGFALFAFIIGDFVNSGSTYFNQKHMNVGEINGEVVKIEEFMASVDQLTSVYKIEMGEENLSEEMVEQIRQSVWDNTVRERILIPETEAIGMTITKAELFDKILGNNIHPMIQGRRVFHNPSTGQFDKNTLAQFISVLEEPETNLPPETKTYWAFWEHAVKNSSLEQKYNALLSNLMGSNSLDAEMEYELNKTAVDVLFAMEPYYAIPDSALTVSDSEIKSRYEKNKEKFKKQNPTCTIEYVTFDIKPSQEDYEEVDKWIHDLLPEFKATDDLSGMVNSNSDKRFVNTPLSKGDIDLDFREFAFSGKTGDVFGPLFSNNVYKMARLVQTDIVAPDSVKLRHIYLAEKSQERTKLLADSLLNVIKNGGDFALLAKNYSKVSQTAENGGEIGWAREIDIDPEIASKAFSTAKGNLFTMESTNGIQIFQVMEVGEKVAKVKMAIIERELVPSSRTQAKLYNDAKQFAALGKDISAFQKNAQDKGLAVIPVVGIDINANRLSNIKNSRQIVRWAFEQKNGATSDVFECDQKFIVATVSKINKGKYEPLSEVSDLLRSELLKEKKGDFILDKLGGKSFNSLMAEGMRADTLRNVTFEAQQLPKVGMEPLFFAMAASGKELPVKGNSGVFIYQIIHRQETTRGYDAAEGKALLDSRNAYAIPYLSIEVLKEKAEIEDNRHVIF